MAEIIMDFPAGSLDYPSSNYAAYDMDSGVNGELPRWRFDDTTEEFVIGQIQVPDDLNTSGTVYIEAYGYAVTADGNEVQLCLYHSPVAKGESWDAGYTAEKSGDYATDANQDELDFIEWSETVSNLGWAANDHVRIKLSRCAIDGGTAVTGDYAVTHLRLRIPTL